MIDKKEQDISKQAKDWFYENICEPCGNDCTDKGFCCDKYREFKDGIEHERNIQPVYVQSNFIPHLDFKTTCCGIFSVADYENGDLKCNECGESLKQNIEIFRMFIDNYLSSESKKTYDRARLEAYKMGIADAVNLNNKAEVKDNG